MNFRHALASCALVLIAAFAPTANADVTWHWQFGAESGTFITDGTFADTSTAGTFTISEFHVESSVYPLAVGATYDLGSQLPEGMIWDGSAPTQFFRDFYTNGSNFYSNTTPSYRYGLVPSEGFVSEDDGTRLTAPLTVTAVGNVVAAAPVATPSLGWTGILLLAALLSGGAVWTMSAKRAEKA